ncbi:MAG: protein kinase [Myxococcales bacterium]|nr:protein kinase [Myxococcales bacterium]
MSAAGAGAFKETYEVRDAEGQRLALKVFRAGMSAERTDREIDAMRRCSHPNIARVVAIDAFESDGERYVFLIEEFLPGGSLADRVQRDDLYTAAEARTLAVALVDALAHIASHNLVHRDFKPENILLDANDSPMIDDFGIVRDLTKESLTQSWAMRGPGTPFYAAPEQLNNEKELIDWRTDQFSLGVVLSVITFGVHPYQRSGMTMDQTVEAVAARVEPADSFVESAMAAGLVALPKMVSSWPVRRFRTPELLAAAWANE